MFPTFADNVSFVLLSARGRQPFGYNQLVCFGRQSIVYHAFSWQRVITAQRCSTEYYCVGLLRANNRFLFIAECAVLHYSGMS